MCCSLAVTNNSSVFYRNYSDRSFFYYSWFTIWGNINEPKCRGRFSGYFHIIPDRLPCRHEKLSSILYEHLSDMWLSTLEIPYAGRSFAPKSLSLCVKRSAIHIFLSDAKAIRCRSNIAWETCPALRCSYFSFHQNVTSVTWQTNQLCKLLRLKMFRL